jgi:S1-C subfamily serine protease
MYFMRAPAAAPADTSALTAPSAVTAAPAESATPEPASAPTVQPAPPLVNEVPAVIAPPVVIPVPEPAAPPVPPSTGAPALEDIVGRATAAIVLIESAGGRGTGFFVAPDLLLTNAHVVTGSTYVTLRMTGGRTMQGRVERSSTDLDLAVIRATTPSDGAQTLEMGSVANVRPGQDVLAIGSPHGLQNTVTRCGLPEACS